METNSVAFSSNAAFRILVTLASTSSAVSFRELVRRANIGIRSAQLAVEKLKSQKLLIVKKFKNQKLFRLSESPALEEIKLIAEHRKALEMKERAEYYSKNLVNIIRMTDELTRYSLKLKELNAK